MPRGPNDRKARVISLQGVREGRDHAALLGRLLELAAQLPPEEGVAGGLARYYAGDPPEEALQDLTDPLDWIFFAYRPPGSDLTLAERIAREDRRLSEREREQLRAWSGGAVAGLFHVLHPGPGEVRLRRLGDQSPIVASDSREGLQAGDLVAGWLLPTGSHFRFGYSSYLVPAAAVRPLEHLIRQDMALLRRQMPGATWNHYYRALWPRVDTVMDLALFFGEECLAVQAASEPAVVGRPQEDPAWQAVAERLAGFLLEEGAHPEEIEGAHRLWWDAVHVLRPRVNRPEPWVGGLLYLLVNRIYGLGATQQEIAEMVGTSAASVGSRSRQIDEALAIEDGDPRYADLMDAAIRQFHRGELLLLLSGATAAATVEGPWLYLPHGDTP